MVEDSDIGLERAGYTELFALQIKPNRKFDDEVIKEAIFGLMHEPPSNHGINRTTWIMPTCLGY
jgi:hypothetical protein